ncbi:MULTISPECIES: hypothetical protein [unclassified Rhizobium]|uniref:hypothetical protein n=1 Tax=unclassified Rhizobium TaxID=2613769 RepID=UPI000BD18CAD|nr:MULTISPECIES: hypothetical protein [unclassified Rhizobium]MDH7805508.1 hypothetical protein [Rhizobium sp. AN67]MDQ4407019.1 hypothetical protein [Rhizobium sp. AN63]SOD60279.1 hypothetical protein SAMN05216595_5170 [Rhizobium sp. AN6A]
MIADITGNVEFEQKLQSMHVDQLHTLAIAWTRQMDTLEGVMNMPRVTTDESADEILEAEYDRLARRLRLIACAITRWKPATDDEASEQSFAVAYLAYHVRMTPDEYRTEANLQ